MPGRPQLHRRPVSFLLACALAYIGGVIGYLPLLVFLLPIKVERLAGEARIDVLTAVVVTGAIVASIANIVFGALSDRAAERGTGRRWGMVQAVIGLVVAYAVLAAAASPTGVITGVILFQLAVNALLAPLMALMAEEVPDAQKGSAASLLALANPAASAFTSALLAGAMLGESGQLMAVPLAVAACTAPLLFSPSGSVAGAGAPQQVASGRDLAIAWVARLLVQVAGNALSLYILYYFESILPGTPRPLLAGAVGQLLPLAYLAPLPFAMVAGRWSDRTGQRKPFLFAAAALAALGLLTMAVAASWAAGAAGFVAYAIGSSVFLALHAGFAMQLLPNPRHRGRDLGVLNLANTLPALGGPLITWWLATPRDFHAVMLLLAGLTLAGGGVILTARGRA